MTSAGLLTSRRFTDFDTSVIYHVLNITLFLLVSIVRYDLRI